MLTTAASAFLLKGRKLKNRLVFPPITTAYATNMGEVTSGLLDYYSRISQGGVGTVIAEATVVNEAGRLTPFSLGIWDEHFITGLSRLAERIMSAGTAAYLQLAHAGPRSFAAQVALSASDIPFIRSQQTRAMTVSEIHRTVEEFVNAAGRARKAGFAGVELHGAHFYLLSSFLSAITNARNDEYGGSTEGRTRIVSEIIQGIKQVAGEDFAVICRFNGQELGEGGIGIDEAKQIALRLEEAGTDCLHISAYHLPVPALDGHVAVPATPIPGKDDPPGVFVGLAAEIRSTVSVPVIAVGKINSGPLAEQILAEGKCDLVAMGRPLIADPEFSKKLLENEEASDCLFCRGCINSLRFGKMVCSVNSDLPL
ncbi:MAG: NADH:flavin oxidoreductase [Dethiobacter sp.]|nr:NADH:flavin oxidoreductase [Dethiobacter sp.]